MPATRYSVITLLIYLSIHVYNSIYRLCDVTKSHILQLFPDLFEGIGTMEDVKVHLDVDPNIEPVVQV